MYLKNYKFSIILLFSFFLFACNTSKNAKQITPESTKLENSLLWKIEGNSLKQASYLFGTIHIIKAEKYFLPKDFSSVFKSVDNVVFEIDMDKMNDVSEQMKLLPKILMKGDTTLKDLITKSEYLTVQKYFKEKGLPLFMFERVKPMFLTIFGEGDFSPSALKNGDYKSYEMEFVDMAKEQNKNKGALETIDYQVSVLDSIPYKYQAKMFLESLKENKNKGLEMDNWIKLYQDQNINALQNSIKSDSSFSKYEKILVINRNKNWIPKMTEYMKKSSTLFAVGAGHLGGNQGVIKLLMKAGYKVSPVK